MGWRLGRIGRLVEDGQWGCVVTSLVPLEPQLREESAGQTRRNLRINFGREAEKMGALRSLWLNLAYCSMNMFMHKMGVVKSIVEVPSNPPTLPHFLSNKRSKLKFLQVYENRNSLALCLA